MKISLIRKTKLIITCIMITATIFLSINIVMRVLYPIDYKDHIHTYSVKYGLDPYLVAAIINVESKYDCNAKSSKNARGLMQIAPVTATWASKELKIENFSLESLYNPEINIMVGCWYLGVLNKEFDNDLHLVLAAYNGGSGNVNKWLSDNNYSEDGKSLKEIPFKETKEYVVKVEKNYKVYKKLYKNQFENRKQNKIDTNVAILIKNFRKLLKKFVFQHV